MVPSLVKMCQLAAMKNVADIRDVGEIRYDVVKPILKKIVTPGQLVNIASSSQVVPLYTDIMLVRD